MQQMSSRYILEAPPRLSNRFATHVPDHNENNVPTSICNKYYTYNHYIGGGRKPSLEV